MPLLNVIHQPQRRHADCLAACAFMVLKYYNINMRYNRIARLLNVDKFGASFYNLQDLSTLGVTVTIDDGSMDVLEAHNANHLPVVTSVETQELSYWNGVATLHAVVVVDIDSTTVSINDPAFPQAPQVIDRTQFESAWLEREYLYAVIQPKSS